MTRLEWDLKGKQFRSQKIFYSTSPRYKWFSTHTKIIESNLPGEIILVTPPLVSYSYPTISLQSPPPVLIITGLTTYAVAQLATTELSYPHKYQQTN